MQESKNSVTMGSGTEKAHSGESREGEMKCCRVCM